MTHDVVIAGAGPNGLMLACELSLAGVRPVVLEREPEPGVKHRANGLVGQVVPMLHRRGLHERLSGSPQPPSPAPAFMFGALTLDLHAVEDNPLYGLPVPQTRIEEVLAERAAELGVEVRRGHELTGLAQDAGGGTVAVDIAAPEGAYRVCAHYLVGADGGRSLVRKLAGIGFPGVTADNGVSRTAHVCVPDHLRDPHTGGLDVPGYGPVPPFSHQRTDRGLISFAPFSAETPLLSTAEWDGAAADRDAPMTLDELRASVRRVLGTDVPFTEPRGPGPHMLRRVVGTNTRLADRYRAGRVLLVGDAAHVHSALGGPGLNLGLQDAVNLGWKLAAEVSGRAVPGLLDTYESERRPAAERVNMQTRAQSVLTGPGGDVTALRELFAELLAEPGNARHIARTMAGADLRYDMGGHRGTGEHPLIGRWAPDLCLRVGGRRVRLDELARDARPLLLDTTEGGTLAAEARRHGGVRAVAGSPAQTPAPAAALLIRPDCYVAWASAEARPGRAEREGLRAALERWFGPAA
ncbi:FAD-dependent oxidoreductase [Streptomonospora sp. PA3]|uniref:FAD-dependent monooxygenase n=1 Tax=Streptomonospora sp. PA3 TaxID=2607326 RepID=UPI0012DF8D21|nr:FAD-dependent monooxygenase [Streptomonospora sp. PA3]MUL40919.1 FAD-dependent oxidoreductase [Streptomonospora sp. PA3]